MTVGQNLKNIREESGLSVEDISSKTKIREKYLLYIEDDDFEKLPSIVYAKGMIKKYAEACGHESEDLLLQFYRENEALLKHVKQKETEQASINNNSFVITYRHIISAIVIVGVSLLLGYFYYNQQQLSDTPRIEIVSPAEFNSVTEDDTILIEGNVENVNELYIEDSEVVVDSAGYFEYTYTLSEGLNTINIKAISQGGTEVDTARNVLKSGGEGGEDENFEENI